MTLLVQSFDGGTATNGTTLTTTNLGGAGQNEFNVVTIGSTAAAVASSTEAHSGTLSGKFTTGATSGASYVAWTTSLGSNGTVYGRAYVYLTANPVADTNIIYFALSGTFGGGIMIASSGQLRIQNVAFGEVSGGPTMPLNAWFRLEWEVVCGTAGSASCTVNYYASPDSATITNTVQDTTGGYGSAGDINTVEFGWTASNISQPAMYLDDVGVSTTGFLGPTVTAISGADTGGGADNATLAATLSDNDTGSGVDSATVVAPVSDSDTGSGADNAIVSIPISGADTGSGADTASVTSISVSAADTGSGADLAVVSTPMSTLQDNFETDDLATLWAGTYGNVDVSDNQCSIECDVDYDSALYSTNTYFLTGSYLYAQVIPYNAASAQTFFFAAASDGDGPGWMYSAGELSAILTQGGVQGTIGFASYNPVNDLWLRIRESSGTIYWDVAPDGVTWTNLYSSTYSIDVSALYAGCSAGDYGSDPPGFSYITDFNVPMPIPPAVDFGAGGDWATVAGSVTTTESYTSAATENFSTGFNSVDFGWTNGNASQPAMYLDNLEMSTSGFVGPVTLITSVGSLAMGQLGYGDESSVSTGSDSVTSHGSLAMQSLAMAGIAYEPVPYFPAQTLLPIKVELLLNGTWTDISSYVYQRDDISITRGRPDETQTVTGNPQQQTMTLNNRNGTFSPNNTNSPFYPYINRNTQLRTSIVGAAGLMNASSYTGYRFCGEVSEWPPAWDNTGTDVYVQITVSGPLRRYVRGAALGSPMRRYYTGLTGDYAPLAYWPCEDLTAATEIANGLNSGNAMFVNGSPEFASNVAFLGSDPIPQPLSSMWHGLTGAATSPSGSGSLFEFTPGTYTWTAPNGVTTVQAIPSGGGGGGGDLSTTRGGGGGGGGGCAFNGGVAVTPGKTYTYIVPPGGSAGFNGGNGSAGGDATFTGDSSTVTGSGGKGGNSGANGGTGGAGGSANTGGPGNAFGGGSGGNGQLSSNSSVSGSLQGGSGPTGTGTGQPTTAVQKQVTMADGVTTVAVKSGGGGGGGGGTGPDVGAGGGGAGAYSAGNIDVTGGSTYTFNAGNGGGGGEIGFKGNYGGNSFVNGDTSSVLATGGIGGGAAGGGGGGGTPNAGTGHTGGRGGDGAESTTTYGGGGGGGGSGAGPNSNGGAGTDASGRSMGDGNGNGGNGGWGQIRSGTGTGTGQSNPQTGGAGYNGNGAGIGGGGGGGAGALGVLGTTPSGKFGAGGGAGWIAWTYTIPNSPSGGGGGGGAGPSGAGGAGQNTGAGGNAGSGTGVAGSMGGGVGGTVGAGLPAVAGGGGAGGLPDIGNGVQSSQNGAPGQVQLSWDGGAISPVAANIIRFALDIDPDGETNDVELMSIVGYGTISTMELIYLTGGHLELIGYNDAAVQQFTSGSIAFNADGVPLYMSISLTADGNNADWVLTGMNALTGSIVATATGTVDGVIVGNVSDIYINPASATLADNTAIGQITVQQYADSLENIFTVVDGYNGETVAARLIRLCAEEEIGCEIVGNAGYDVTVSPDAPAAWWKLADGSGSTAIDSSGGGSTGTAANVTFGNTNEAVAGDTSAAFNGSTSTITTSYNPSGLTAMSVEAWVNLNNLSQTGNPRVICNSHSDVDNLGFELFLNGGNVPCAVFGNGTGHSFITNAVAVPATGWTHLVSTWDSATGITSLYINGQIATAGSLAGIVAAGANGTSIGFNDTTGNDYVNGLIAECAVYSYALTPAQVQAHYTQATLSDDTPQMGPQIDDTFANLLQYCESVDLGLLFETTDQLGIGYRTRVSMLGQNVGLQMDYSLSQLANALTPVSDDQYLRNDVTITRNGGASAVWQDTSGPLSLQDPPNGVGDYTYANTVYCYADAQLLPMATWIGTVGTVDDYRYPQINIDLSRAAAAGLLGQAGGMEIGDFLQVINTPTFLSASPIAQLMFGYTETINAFKWTMSINAVPEAPYGEGSPPIW